MSIIPNVDPSTFSMSAVVVGYLLSEELTVAEQHALSSWLALASQVLGTTAYYRQFQRARQMMGEDRTELDEINMLKKMVDVLNKEIENLKKYPHS